MHERCRAVAQRADAADEPHGGWKVSKVAYLHLKSGSQLIRGVRRLLNLGWRTIECHRPGAEYFARQDV